MKSVLNELEQIHYVDSSEMVEFIRMNSDMVEMNAPVGVANGMLAQNVNIGEMQEWQPTNMKDFNFPM
jgi:hypothetical protein